MGMPTRPEVPNISSDGVRRLDLDQEVTRLTTALRDAIGGALGRAGAVVAVSGGIDSSVCAALAVRAVGAPRVLALALPERESDRESLQLARTLTDHLGIDLVVEDITPCLEAVGCYARRDAAIRRLTPYGPGWRSKLVVQGGGPTSDRLPLSYLAVQAPDGTRQTLRLPVREHREIVAATNFKQRIRTMLAYHHADRLQYAVIGTPNRLEDGLGFFVKGGDGLADVKPIAHLYKSEVYALAERLDLPAAIRTRIPTTDTYTLSQTQEEFFFGTPLPQLDVLLAAHDAERPAAEAAGPGGFDVAAVERVYREIERKQRAAEYLHAGALRLAERVEAGLPRPAGIA